MNTGVSRSAAARRWDTLQGALLGAFAGSLLDLLGLRDVAGIGDAALIPLVGIALGALTGWFGAVRAAAIIAGSLLIAAGLIAALPWTPIMNKWVRVDPLPDHPVGAIVVLSSGLASDSTLLDSGPDRLLGGLELFRNGVAPRLVTTRVVRYSHGVRITSDADQRRLVWLAGAESAWTMVDSVGVTRDEATGSAALLFPLGVREVALVTSASHTRRACAAFEKVGFVVHCRPALERDRRTWHAATTDQRLSVFRAVVYELLGTAKYRMNRWI